MGQLVNIRSGRWDKTEEGGWKFEREDSEDDSSAHAPITLLTSEDIEIMMSVKEWKNEVVTCVTYGAVNIAKYQFLCRTPFTIGDTTYLGDGISEEEHCSMINLAMVEDDEFTCVGSVLKQLFSEEKLILVYRFSFEIEKARKNFDLLPSPEISGTRKEIEERPTTHQRNEANGEDQSPSDYPEESIIRLNVDEEHDYLNDDWAEVVSGQQNWDNGIDPECYVTAAIPHYLTSRTNDDDTSTPGFNVNVFDLDTSSTGSTGDVNVTVIGNTCWNPINVPMTENSDRGVGADKESDIYVGMIFNSLEDFKLHMAMYAIRNIYRF
uniref:Uncharacterized protein n=2 Tax=Brassica oleracea TaxID=3712 RepID=A0A0D3E9X4_BRAOL|nr:unnamed protein product [Brassica oleracea]